MKPLHRTQGFTLVELLMVCGIISLLAAVVFTNTHKALEYARDAKRKQTLVSLRTALELYHEKYGKYPDTGGSNNYYSSEPGNAVHYGLNNNGEWIPGLVQSGVIAELPHDPLGGQQVLNAIAVPCSGWVAAYDYTSDGNNYKLVSHCALEMLKYRTLVPGDQFFDPRRSDHAIMVCSGEPACGLTPETYPGW